MENKKELALEYYEAKKFSLTKCAEIAEMTIEEFIMYLGTHKISRISYIFLRRCN